MVSDVALKKGICGLFAKCKLVGSHGQSLKSSTGESKTSMVGSLSAGRQGVMSFGNSFVFKADQLANNKNAFFRIEFYVGDGLAISTSIGAAFVPVEYCTSQKAKVLAFPVTRFRADSSVVSLAAKDGKGYGQVMLKCYREEKGGDDESVGEYKKDSDSVARGSKLDICSTMHQSTVYNTEWLAHCVPPGTKFAKKLAYVERAQVYFSFDGLELVDIALDDENASNTTSLTTLGSHDSQYDLQKDLTKPQTGLQNQKVAKGLRGTRPSFYEAPSERDVEAVIEIFYNQRRDPFPPFDWGTTALTHALFSNQDYTLDYKFSDLKDCQLPEGLEWVDSEWKIDKKHIKTDENGWIYGFSFAKIIANYEKQVSYAYSSATSHARRQKLIRKVRVSPSSGLSSEIAASSLQRLFDHCNTVHGGSPSVSVGSHPPLPALQDGVADPSDWRNDLARKYPDALLMTCQERGVNANTGKPDSIMIPWQQISNVSVITPSILSLTFSVNRYFPAQIPANAAASFHATPAKYRPAEVEVFISNCSAHALKTFYEERFYIAKIRDDFRIVQSSDKVLNSRPFEDDVENSGLATMELSSGSEMMSDLDDRAIDLQNKVDSLTEKFNQSGSVEVGRELMSVYERLCRVRLYMASLIGIGFTDWHEFDIKNVDAIMWHDFSQCRKIELENSVLTANNRIEYLLDVAEKRIRDAAIAGWDFKGQGFEQYIEMLTNDYLTEITGILAAYFEESGQAEAKVSFQVLHHD
jgi:hypothetical protein